MPQNTPPNLPRDPVWETRDKLAVRNVFRYWSPRSGLRHPGRALRQAEQALNMIGRPADWYHEGG